MNVYSKTDLDTIREQYAPTGTVCRVVTVRHTFANNYTTVETKYFATRQEGLEYADQDGGAEVRMPEYQGDIAFSADGKLVRMFTQFA